MTYDFIVGMYENRDGNLKKIAALLHADLASVDNAQNSVFSVVVVKSNQSVSDLQILSKIRYNPNI